MLTTQADVQRARKTYQKTFSFPGQCINEHHAFYETCPLKKGVQIDVGIPGWLQRNDALLLYEMAYFCSGDILELGCHQGLSTSIMAKAIFDSGQQRHIVTNDLLDRCTAETDRNLCTLNLQQYATTLTGDSAYVCSQLRDKGQQFGFAFVDHAHTYTEVYEVCKTLPDLIAPGGYCAFHDFADARNFDSANSGFGVWSAINDSLDSSAFTFSKVVGCCGLFQRVVR